MLFTKKIGEIQSKDFGKIEFYESNEYEKFKMFDANRSVLPGHVKRLVKSMGEELLFSPIFVDKDFHIVDGQHRFNALREIGSVIIFCIIKNVGLPQVTRYNMNAKNWNDDDFLNMYVELDYREYKTYKFFKEKYKLSHTSCKALLGGLVGAPQKGSGNRSMSIGYDPFKAGEFICKSLARGERIAQLIEKLNFEQRKCQNFVSALIKIDGIKYDRNRMVGVVNSNAHRLNHTSKPTKDYLFLLSDMYNYHLGKENRVQFYDPSEILVYN